MKMMQLRDVLDNAAAFSILGSITVCHKDRDDCFRVFRETQSPEIVLYYYLPSKTTFPGLGPVQVHKIPDGQESEKLRDLNLFVDFDSEDWEISSESKDMINKIMEDLILRSLAMGVQQ